MAIDFLYYVCISVFCVLLGSLLTACFVVYLKKSVLEFKQMKLDYEFEQKRYEAKYLILQDSNKN